MVDRRFDRLSDRKDKEQGKRYKVQGISFFMSPFAGGLGENHLRLT